MAFNYQQYELKNAENVPNLNTEYARSPETQTLNSTAIQNNPDYAQMLSGLRQMNDSRQNYFNNLLKIERGNLQDRRMKAAVAEAEEKEKARIADKRDWTVKLFNMRRAAARKDRENERAYRKQQEDDDFNQKVAAYKQKKLDEMIENGEIPTTPTQFKPYAGYDDQKVSNAKYYASKMNDFSGLDDIDSSNKYLAQYNVDKYLKEKAAEDTQYLKQYQDNMNQSMSDASKNATGKENIITGTQYSQNPSQGGTNRYLDAINSNDNLSPAYKHRAERQMGNILNTRRLGFVSDDVENVMLKDALRKNYGIDSSNLIPVTSVDGENVYFIDPSKGTLLSFDENGQQQEVDKVKDPTIPEEFMAFVRGEQKFPFIRFTKR